MFEGLYWITIYHTATPLLKSRLRDAGCIVYQGDESYFNRFYALFEDEEKMKEINRRHYRSIQMVLDTYKGPATWLNDGHHTKLEFKQEAQDENV